MSLIAFHCSLRRPLLLGLAAISFAPPAAASGRIASAIPDSSAAATRETLPPPSAPADTLRSELRLPHPIVVTASRREQPKIEAPRSIEVVSRERIDEMQAHSVPEALEATTGVSVQQTNRGAGAPIIRGLIGPQNLIVVDGVRFNTSTFRTGPNQYLATIDPSAVDRIEVVRGPSSILYGNGAIGGVIQLFTATPRVTHRRFTLDGQAAVSFQSADAARGATVQVEGSRNDIAALAGGSFTRFDRLRSGGGREVPLSEYDANGWHSKIVYSRSRAWSLIGGYIGTALRDAARTDQLGRGDVSFYDNDDHLALLAYRHEGAGAWPRLDANISYHRARERVERCNCLVSAEGVVFNADSCAKLYPGVVNRKRRSYDEVEVLGGGLNAAVELLGRRLRLDGGVENYEDRVASRLEDAKAAGGFVFKAQPRGNFSDGSRYSSLGLYAHARARLARSSWGRTQLLLAGGSRFSRFAAHASQVPGIGDVDYRYSGLVGSAGLQLLLADDLNLYAAFVQGFRAPNLQETTVLGDTGSKFEIPNDALRPERSDMLELGGKMRAGRWAFAAAAFRNALDDAIDEKPSQYHGQSQVNGEPVIQRVNATEGVYFGIESSLELHFGPVALSNAMAWTNGDVTGVDGTTHPARRVPPLFGLAAVRYEQSARRHMLEISLRWAARQKRLHPSDEKDLRICESPPYSGVLSQPCQGTPGWVTLNMRSAWHVTNLLRADVALTNLADRRYRVHGSGFDAPGFDARAALSTEF